MSTIVTRAGKGSALTWTEGDANITNLNTDKIENLLEDLTPQLGGDLDVNGKSIVSVSNGDIAITPNGTGNIVLEGQKWPQADGTANQVLKTDGAGQLSWATVSGGGSGTVTSISGTGTVNGLTLTGTVTTTGSLTLGGTLDLSAPPAIGATTASTGTFTNLTSTGTFTFENPIEPLFDLGTTGGTVAPDPANGSVQKITLNSALTLNAFTNATAGESMTLIIYGGTAYTSITSTMKFAGGIKTLTGTAGCIDIVSIYFDGTTYFASLGKGYA